MYVVPHQGARNDGYGDAEPHQVLAAADLPKLRFHDLRRTTATLLLEANVNPKVVSDMLGHTEVGITMNLYQHVTPTMNQHAATALDGLPSGAWAGPGISVAVSLTVKHEVAVQVARPPSP
jgi:integrase